MRPSKPGAPATSQISLSKLIFKPIEIEIHFHLMYSLCRLMLGLNANSLDTP
jgi:hypothetical protein